MASRVRKRLNAAERREKILAAAVKALARQGYDNTSMDRIAAAAKITKPVLYDHFPSKRALFHAVLQSIRDGLIGRAQAIAQAIAGAGGGPEEKFRRGVDAFLQFVEEAPDAARVLLTVPRGDPHAAEVSRTVQASATAGIMPLLAAFMPGSPAWQLQAAAEFLKEGLHAVAVWWLDHPDHARAELLDTVMDIAWSGLRHRNPQRPS
jgi:AcrR family transcriptional regulator